MFTRPSCINKQPIHTGTSYRHNISTPPIDQIVYTLTGPICEGSCVRVYVAGYWASCTQQQPTCTWYRITGTSDWDFTGFNFACNAKCSSTQNFLVTMLLPYSGIYWRGKILTKTANCRIWWGDFTTCRRKTRNIKWRFEWKWYFNLVSLFQHRQFAKLKCSPIPLYSILYMYM